MIRLMLKAIIILSVVVNLWLQETGIAQTIPSLQTQTPVSFRSQALGGIIFDDLDLAYDPIELRFVEGARLYTNLSNHTSGQEQFLNGIADNTFLMGISWKNSIGPNWRSSLLFRFQNARFSNPLSLDSNLDGLNDLFGAGNLESSFTAFLDTDFDDLHDTKDVVHRTGANISFDKTNTFLLNNTVVLSYLTLGISVLRGKTSAESGSASVFLGSSFGMLIGTSPGDPSFTLTQSRVLLEDNFQTLTHSEDGNFSSVTEKSFTQLLLSGMKPISFPFMEEVEARLDLGYLKTKDRTAVDDRYSGRFQPFDTTLTEFEDSYTETDNYANTLEETGSGFLLGLSLKRIFDKAAKRKNDGFWHVGFVWQRKGMDYTEEIKTDLISEDIFFDGQNSGFADKKDRRTNSFVLSNNGDQTTWRRTAWYGIVNIPFGERGRIGLGGIILSNHISRKTDMLQDTRNIRDFELTDNQSTGDDFVKTTSFQITADANSEYSQKTYRLPVGIEYQFTNNKKWAVRLGSMFTYTTTENNQTAESITITPTTEITEYGDGDIEKRELNTEFTLGTSSSEDAESRTTFLYGMGYRPNKHLQVDVLGFFGTEDVQVFDAEFFRSLRLSVSVKF